jgi:hypothetical protein
VDDSGIRALQNFPEVRNGLFSGLILGVPYAGHLTCDRSDTREGLGERLRDV